jgi:hypothetical protein
MKYHWWREQPVLEIIIDTTINTRDEAYQISKLMVDQIEESGYPHVIVILDLSPLKSAPSATTLLSGSLPETLKIEHLILVNAPTLFRFAVLPFAHLRDKIHFVSSSDLAHEKTFALLPQLPA